MRRGFCRHPPLNTPADSSPGSSQDHVHCRPCLGHWPRLPIVPTRRQVLRLARLIGVNALSRHSASMHWCLPRPLRATLSFAHNLLKHCIIAAAAASSFLPPNPFLSCLLLLATQLNLPTMTIFLRIAPLCRHFANEELPLDLLIVTQL